MTTETIPPRPTALEVKPAGIPYELYKIPLRSCYWRYELREGKWTKVPYHNRTHAHGRADSTNSATWCSWPCMEQGTARGYDGVGFFFSDQDDICGVDLDGCLAPDGTMAPWAAEIVASFGDTHCEISPSRTGVKLFLRGKWPREKRNKLRLDDEPKVCDKTPAIEVYDRERYFCVTGHPWPKFIEKVNGNHAKLLPSQTALDALAARFPLKAKATSAQSAHKFNGDVSADDQAILDKARSAKNRAKFERLWSGDTSDHGGDHSAADQALVNLLAFYTGPDPARIDGLFRQSGLCRDKWTERADYRESTIGNALAGTREFYKWNGNGSHNGNGHSRAATNGATAVINGESVKLSQPSDEAPHVWLPAGRTDAANSRRFIAEFGDRLHWVDPWRAWLVYDGRRWNRDLQCRVVAWVKRSNGRLWDEVKRAADKCDEKLQQELVRFAKSSNSATGIRNTLELARSEPGIAVLPEDLDSHPWLLNAANGVIDLRNGELRPHDAKLLLTKITPIQYVVGPEAECPAWEEALDKIFAGRLDLLRFVQRLFGSALVGEVIEHILPIFWGDGSNGKSLATETLIDVFGEYADKASQDLLLTKDGNAHPTEKADLFGKRLVFAVETDAGRQLSEATVKELTGGDTVHARRMREDFWSFRPQHTCILVTNHRPRVRGTDHGLWRRLRLVPYTVRFWDPSRGESGPPELEADKRLKEKLKAEYPAILSWLVRGCLDWQRHGLGEPDAVREATANYRDFEDVLGKFLGERTEPVEDGRVKASDLRTVYEQWCKNNGETPCSGRRFGEYMRERGIEKVRSNGPQYLGIVLVD